MRERGERRRNELQPVKNDSIVVTEAQLTASIKELYQWIDPSDAKVREGEGRGVRRSVSLYRLFSSLPSMLLLKVISESVLNISRS